MPDWLLNSFTMESSFTYQQLLLRLVVAAVFGAGVALFYRLGHGRTKSDASVLTATLVLLSILIAMVSMVIGDSVARAFSLVGALSIVRFRTIVDDTRDTAFVIFAVVVGMAAGAGLLLVPLLGLPIVGLVSFVLSRPVIWNKPSEVADCTLSIRLGMGHDPEKVLSELLPKHVESHRLRGISTARQGTALDLDYKIRMKDLAQLPAFVMELNRIDGVESVEVKV
jgi:uncharacterized membrane protein YhiD involved in acid resistance